MYGGDWVMGYMPADQGKHFDDAKAWYEFDFDRDGPERRTNGPSINQSWSISTWRWTAWDRSISRT